MTPSHPIRVMIVDDEPPAREGLRLRLRREPDVVIIGEFGNTEQALAAIRADPPDVLFLDVQMPGLDGFALLDRAGTTSAPVVIFVTAHDQHAVRAFDVRALDFLLKPVDQARLQEAVARAREHLARLRQGEIVDRMRGLLHGDAGAAVTTLPSLEEVSHLRPAPVRHERQAGRADRIPVRSDGSIQFVDVRDIDWVEASGDCVRLHVASATHNVRRSMGEMLAMLDPTRFVRIHRSTIVNLDRVRELQPFFHGEYVVILKDGTRLKLSRGHRESLGRLMG